MSPQTPTTSINFSSTETKFLLAYIKNIISKPEVNWEAIAMELGYAKPVQAQKYFSALKIKHGLGMSSSKGKAAPVSYKELVTPTPRLRKRGAGSTLKETAQGRKKAKLIESNGPTATTDDVDFDDNWEEV
ncbi:hypothetical protein BDZ45DRAFT_745605 [Acephala macrosclerotiorum]|nr:hypothetical protein BDZ45DRAFT_745605 [Acephala macrosclerotiorum]